MTIKISKDAILSSLRKIDIKQNLCLMFQNNEFQITKIDKNLFKINPDICPLKFYSYASYNNPLKNKNEVTLQEIRKYFKWSYNFYIDENHSNNIKELFGRENISLNKNKNKLLEQAKFMMDVSHKFHNAYVKNVKESCEIITLDKAKKYKDVLSYFHNNTEFLTDIKVHIMHYDFNYEFYFNMIEKTCNDLNIKNERLDKHKISVNFGKIFESDVHIRNKNEKDYITIFESRVIISKIVNFNQSCEERYKEMLTNSISLDDLLKKDSINKIKYNDVHLFIKSNVIINNLKSVSSYLLKRCYNFKYDYFQPKEIYYSHINKFEKDIIPDIFNILIKNIKSHVDLRSLYAQPEIKKDVVSYILDFPAKQKIYDIKITKNKIIGRYYCVARDKDINGNWDIKTLKALDDETKYNLLKYEFRTFTPKTFDWDILPYDCNMLFRERDKDEWSTTSLFHKIYDESSGTWSNPRNADQHYHYNVQDIYNFTIIDFPKDLYFERKKDLLLT